MALHVDAMRALRTHGELVALVEAIRDAPTGEPETDTIEWKTDWDLSEAAVRFQTARHLLGFGNRTVTRYRGSSGTVSPGLTWSGAKRARTGKLARSISAGCGPWSPGIWRRSRFGTDEICLANVYSAPGDRSTRWINVVVGVVCRRQRVTSTAVDGWVTGEVTYSVADGLVLRPRST